MTESEQVFFSPSAGNMSFLNVPPGWGGLSCHINVSSHSNFAASVNDKPCLLLFSASLASSNVICMAFNVVIFNGEINNYLSLRLFA